jgi:hypothetical protein
LSLDLANTGGDVSLGLSKVRPLDRVIRNSPMFFYDVVSP